MFTTLLFPETGVSCGSLALVWKTLFILVSLQDMAHLQFSDKETSESLVKDGISDTVIDIANYGGFISVFALSQTSLTQPR